MRKILMVAEPSSSLHPLTLEVAGFTAVLAAITGAHMMASFIGGQSHEAANRFSSETGIESIVIENSGFDSYSAEGFAAAVSALAGELSPDCICIPHTARGYDYAPRLAIRLNACCISEVQNIRAENGTPVFSRMTAHGKLEADFRPTGEKCVITVASGSFAPLVSPLPKAGTVTIKKIPFTPQSTLQATVESATEESVDLNKADVIVSAGKGVGKPENMALLEQLASLFPRSSVAGSRVACDHGLVDYSRQVGMTGKTVAPKLYVACGISGSLQHIAGMKNSRTIVAINHDPDAPIFTVSDIGIVEDLRTFIPLFIEEAKRRRSR